MNFEIILLNYKSTKYRESIDFMNYYKKWKKHAVIGVTLVGLGINLVAEATIIKSGGPPNFDFWHAAKWFWTGLFGIVSVNAGICFVADAVKNRVFMEIEDNKEV